MILDVSTVDSGAADALRAGGAADRRKTPPKAEYPYP